jgi:hypothetical protein
MYIMINHDQCKHASAFADRCLANTMRYPLGHERYCMAEQRDDGSDSITIVLRKDGQEWVRVFESEQEASMWAMDGSLAFSFV